jgi:hypothetical protein
MTKHIWFNPTYTLEDLVPVPKPRRVLPEHEGKYKVTMPKGTTARSREILKKLVKETNRVTRPVRGVQPGEVIEMSVENVPIKIEPDDAVEVSTFEKVAIKIEDEESEEVYMCEEFNEVYPNAVTDNAARLQFVFGEVGQNAETEEARVSVFHRLDYNARTEEPRVSVFQRLGWKRQAQSHHPYRMDHKQRSSVFYKESINVSAKRRKVVLDQDNVPIVTTY